MREVARSTTVVDVLIVGGGIAGLSLAAALPGRLSTVLIEGEASFAFHTSGRSARQMQPSYGPPPIRLLTRASIPMVEHIAEEVGSVILRRRPLIWFATAGYDQRLATLASEVPTLGYLTDTETHRRCPALRVDKISSAVIDEDAFEVRVPTLIAQFVARAQNAGAILKLNSAVRTARRAGGVWHVSVGDQVIQAKTVVNAAGPWADTVARMFGARPLDLIPHRRTVVVARPYGRVVEQDWAMASDISLSLYFRPDGDNVLMSPSEEVPSDPCDAVPWESDIARLYDRINVMTDLDIRDIESSWAGLRTFPNDHLPVVGFDEDLPNFYWLAGQGGYGIQTAPVLSVLVAKAISGEDHDLGARLDSILAQFSPNRSALRV